MQYIKHGLLLVAAIVGQSCVTSSNTFWVSGIKTPCSMGMVQTQCLNVHRAEDLHQPEWENFYAPIEGFEFEACLGELCVFKVVESWLASTLFATFDPVFASTAGLGEHANNAESNVTDNVNTSIE